MTADTDDVIEGAAEILQHAFSGHLAPEVADKFPYVLLLAMNGWQNAHQALCDYASRLTHEGKSLPMELQTYIVMTARDGFVEKKKYKNMERDIAICVAIRELLDCGYDATRNAATTDEESACSLISKALNSLGIHISESGVMKIWNRKGLGLRDLPASFPS